MLSARASTFIVLPCLGALRSIGIARLRPGSGWLIGRSCLVVSKANWGSLVYDNAVINRLYIHNFRCLQNFELPISGRSSVLLIGKNGAGKTTVGFALEILQKIARGTNRVGELIKPKDLTRGHGDSPTRFEIEVKLDDQAYGYSIAFEYPEDFRELRVFEEKLTVNSKVVYSRELAKVHLTRSGQEREANFSIDWHLVALPIIQQATKDLTKDPIYNFKKWLSSMLILRPMPSLILGNLCTSPLPASLLIKLVV